MNPQHRPEAGIVTGKCEAIRRDGTRCYHAWKHVLLGLDRPADHLHNVYLCGQHKNALGKGIMVVPVIADPGRRDAFVSMDRDGNAFYGDYEARS